MDLAADQTAGRDRASPADASDRDDDIRRVLHVARSVMGLEAAYASVFVSDTQVFTHVVAEDDGPAPRQGSADDLTSSYCLRVLDGRLPPVVPDVSVEPEVSALPATRDLGLGAYVGVPICGDAGHVIGMLCCTSSTPAEQLRDADLTVLQGLAALLGALIGPAPAPTAGDASRRAEMLRVIRGEGRRPLLQPIVDVRAGTAVGAEVLTRFDGLPSLPDQWFAEAASMGLLEPLEVAAARDGLRAAAGRSGYVSINLSPSVIVAADLDEVLSDVDLDRVVLEVTEHAAVDDYGLLDRCLAPYRAAGLRLAIDDAGAGYASFRHILRLRPEYIKVDLSLVRDIHLDPVRQALTASMLTFARTAGAQVIAEGVETQDELDTLARLGITLMQGYRFGRPTAAPPEDGYASPSRHVVVDATTELAVVLADAVRQGHGLEQLTRPLLDAVVGITGLETSFLTVRHPDDRLEHRYVRNAGTVELPEGFTIPWSESLCSAMQDRGLTWTNDAAADLSARPAAAEFGLSTFVSTPLVGVDGVQLGTLCAGSRSPVYVSDTTIAQLQLISHVLAARLHEHRVSAPGVAP